MARIPVHTHAQRHPAVGALLFVCGVIIGVLIVGWLALLTQHSHSWLARTVRAGSGLGLPGYEKS